MEPIRSAQTSETSELHATALVGDLTDTVKSYTAMLVLGGSLLGDLSTIHKNASWVTAELAG
jgi:hypothetical protein